jgi:MYXO-CTERM domain-containing protein
MSGSEYDERPGGRIRIGDKEREDAVQRLGAHYEAGRLTAEEHTERIGEALQAKTEADLAALFADLPDEGRAAGPTAEEQPEQSGPWGWGLGAPWTAPQEGQGGRGPGKRAPWGAGGPPWAQGRKGPLSRIPLPVLVALAAIGVLASIACVVGGHPPVLPLLLIVAGILVVRRRRQERRA